MPPGSTPARRPYRPARDLRGEARGPVPSSPADVRPHGAATDPTAVRAPASTRMLAPS